MRFFWDEGKNSLLKKQRKISFEEIVLSMESRQIVDVIEHPNQEKYRGQIFILVKRNRYIYVVPASISNSGDVCHLKTIYPSRKYTDKYIRSNE